MNYKQMSYISGAVIFFGMVTVLLAVMWLSSGNIFFSKDYSIFAKFPEVTGLREQSPVFLRGYRIGVVKDVTFLKDGIVIRLNINKRFSIPSGSGFAVSTVNLIGEKAISISPVDTATAYMQSGDTVLGENKDMMIALQGLLSGLQKNIDAGAIQTRVSRVGESIDLMQSILKKLDVKLDQIDAAAINRDLSRIGAAADEARDLLKDNRPGLEQLTSDGRDALARVSVACDQIGRMAQSVQAVSDQIATGNGAITELLNNRQTIDNLNLMLADLAQLITDIKANPHRYLKVSLF
jgi:phospholipid/cholesterol/gamma-HCH transport system substrate-binding protein